MEYIEKNAHFPDGTLIFDDHAFCKQLRTYSADIHPNSYSKVRLGKARLTDLGERAERFRSKI